MASVLVEALNTICDDPRRRLDSETLRACAKAIFAGQAEDAQIGGLLMALRLQGESEEELEAFVSEMLAAASDFPRPEGDGPLVDTCGVGGDGYNTFNISTASGLVVAAAGVPVAKHGNRSASSQCGSADVLEALGYPLDLPPAHSARILADHGFCFLFARTYHPGMRHAAPARKALGIRTLFNLCGPLANPARPTHQLVGVSEKRHIEPMAKALRDLGLRGALVVRGADGLDEISISQATEGIRLDEDGELHRWSVSPMDMGISPVEMVQLIGGDPEINAEMVSAVIDGKTGPHADVVNLNAGAVLWMVGMERSLEAGFARAREVQQSGAAGKLFDAVKAAAKAGA